MQEIVEAALAGMSKFAVVAVFASPVIALVFNTLSRRHERRKSLRDGVEKALANPAFNRSVARLVTASESDVVFQAAVRKEALVFINIVRRLAEGTSRQDWKAVVEHDEFHRFQMAWHNSRVLVQCARKTELNFAGAPILGDRAKFASSVEKVLRQ